MDRIRILQMEHVFDNLPLEVIRHYIFPYLDYDGRVALNACLPRRDYIKTRLNMDEVLKFHLRIICAILRTSIRICNTTRCISVRQTQTVIFLEDLRKYLFITQYFTSFRELIQAKCAEFKDFASGWPDYTDKVNALCDAIIDDMNTKYPYLREIILKEKTYWETPVIHPFYIPTRPDLMTYA